MFVGVKRRLETSDLTATTVPACSSGPLTNVLRHRNAMPQIQNMTPHPVTEYRHSADLSLCYSLLLWNVTLEYTTLYPF